MVSVVQPNHGAVEIPQVILDQSIHLGLWRAVVQYDRLHGSAKSFEILLHHLRNVLEP